MRQGEIFREGMRTIHKKLLVLLIELVIKKKWKGDTKFPLFTIILKMINYKSQCKSLEGGA